MPEPGARIIAIANQKGGVGKTTTAINLGAGLAEQGRRVLLVDLDPQGNASTGLGIEREDRPVTTYDLLVGEATAAEASRPTGVCNLSIIPATTDLSSADIDLYSNEKRTRLLREALRPAVAETDYILIDCPPALSLLTINALIAADSLLVPLQAEFYALEGLSQLMLTVRELRSGANPDLRIEGIVLTMVDRRNNLASQVEEDARENLGELVFQTVIPRNVRLSEAPSFARPVLEYDTTSTGAAAYRALAAELIARQPGKES
ncbi:ParA family protein [Pseudoroseicyclus tamaricis]|uniref:Chromosome partitioning protein ParA n=1 Tax=Pseudoroseicyclus tamaricis TaxID=2705421 RepID=A0A6B2JMF5_9RHOB|nr:AAA family ATPase [Pseudoroseicyclus tamaricis]NDV02773.1 ParA family protein [Pseudoroseicyclus tamaricis]